MSEEIPRADTRSRLLRVVGAIVVVAVIVGAVGSIGQLSGAGWFGYRTFLYGDGQLYALNMSPKQLWISVDGRERVEVPAENANIVDLVGGTSSVEVYAAETGGKAVDSYSVKINDSHAFLKLTDDACVAVVNITPFYGGQQKPMLDFEAFLKPHARLWIPQSKNVVWPRKDFPSRLQGGEGKGLWFEIVACELFEEVNFLDAYLATRIEQRMAKALGKDKGPK